MGSHLAAQPQDSVAHESAAGDCHGSLGTPASYSSDDASQHESHSSTASDDDSRSTTADHASHNDCCDADGDCRPGHCSATLALTQESLALLPWYAIPSSPSRVLQVRAPIYPLYRPPISA